MSRLTRFIFRLTDQSDLAFVACVFLLLLMGYLLHGCSTISMTTPEGYQASYTRWGDQQIQGFRMEKDNLGLWRVTLEKQSSEARILDAIGALVGVAQ